MILDVRASHPTLPGPALAVRISLSVLVGLIFLIVGSLVWLYSSEWRVSAFLFSFCLFAAWAFGVETGAAAGDHLLSTVESTSSSIVLAMLVVVLLLFPHTFLASAARYARMVRVSLVLLLGLCAVAVGGTLLFSFSGISNPRWLNNLIYCSMLLSLLGSTLASGVFFSRGSESAGAAAGSLAHALASWPQWGHSSW